MTRSVLASSSAGLTTVPPRQEAPGTRRTTAARGGALLTGPVLMAWDLVLATPTALLLGTTTAAGPVVQTGPTSLSPPSPTWRRYTATSRATSAAGGGALPRPGVATGSTAVRRTWTVRMVTSVLGLGRTGGVSTLTSVRTTGSSKPLSSTAARTRPAPTATAPGPVPATRDTRTSRPTSAAATSTSAPTPAGTPGWDTTVAPTPTASTRSAGRHTPPTSASVTPGSRTGGRTTAAMTSTSAATRAIPSVTTPAPGRPPMWASATTSPGVSSVGAALCPAVNTL